MPHPDGTPVWFELTTPDPAAAAAFYTAVAGWQVAASPVAEHGGYRLAGPDPETGVATVRADALLSGVSFLVTAANSGGRAELGLSLRVIPAEPPALAAPPKLLGSGRVGVLQHRVHQRAEGRARGQAAREAVRRLQAHSR